MADENTSVNTVSWQTAFWTLIPLAIGAMTQPSGRVLGTPIRYRTYLCSSPIICALDAACFVARIPLNSFYHHLSLRQSLALTIANRYRNAEHSYEGLQGLLKQTWLRWVWFLLGTLGPAVKLAAMENVPWTKSWGMMFLGAWVVFEVMGFVDRRVISLAKRMHQGFENTANSPNDEDNLESDYIILRHFQSEDTALLERWVFRTALFLHIMLLLWAIFDLWGMRTPVYYEYGMYSDHFGRFTPLVAAILPLLLFSGIPFILAGILFHIFQKLRNKRYGWESFDLITALSSSLLVLVACFVSMGLGSYSAGKIPLEFSTLYIDIPILYGVLGGASLAAYLINLVSSKYPRLGNQLLGNSHSDMLSSRDREADLSVEYNLVLFLVNLTVSVLWFAFRFNSEGTMNPSWTGIFG